MAFEERVDVHSESWCENFSHKTLKIKVSQPKKDEVWNTPAKCHLKKWLLPFFQKKDTAIEFNQKKILFTRSRYLQSGIYRWCVQLLLVIDNSWRNRCFVWCRQYWHKPKYVVDIDTYLTKLPTKRTVWLSLNTAFAYEGAYINIPKSKVADKPIEIMYFLRKWRRSKT
jgi:Fe-S cluster assembly protein SufD